MIELIAMAIRTYILEHHPEYELQNDNTFYCSDSNRHLDPVALATSIAKVLQP